MPVPTESAATGQVPTGPTPITPDTATPVPTITVVRTPACHLCADAQDALAELARGFPIRVEVLDLDTGHGQALVAAHRPTMFPLVLVDEVFFSAGRLPRRKLRALLTARAATAGPGSRTAVGAS
jgi:hypothetical protein